MIVLVLPMYSKQELNADSNYVVYTQLIRAMLKMRPHWHFYVIFPDDKSGYRYQPDGFFRLPNVTRIPQRISPRKMGNAVSFDSMWWDVLFRKLAFDVVWVNLIEQAGAISASGTATFERAGRPMIVGAHNYVIHDSLPYPFKSMEHVALAQIMGAFGCNAHVFNSEHCQSMFFETAARFLNEGSIERLKATAHRINYGTLEQAVTEPFTRKANPVPIIAYNHRLQSYKNYKQTFALLDRLYKEGLKFKLWFINNTIEKAAGILAYPFVETKLCATRAEYIATLRHCDLNVTNSQHETFCIAAVESMAMGQPIVAPNGVTFPEITGRASNQYPFLFDTEDEQLSMLRALIVKPALRKKWGDIVARHVADSYNSALWAQRYAELFEKLEEDFRPNPPDDAKEMISEQIKRNNGATLEMVYGDIIHRHVNGRTPFSSQSLPLVKMLRLARAAGARVVVENGQERVRL